MVKISWRPTARTCLGIVLCAGLALATIPGVATTLAVATTGDSSPATRSTAAPPAAAALADNGRILFHGTIGGHDGIYSIWPNGQGLRLLIEGSIGAPSYDPTGRRIAFTRCRRGCDVWVMRSDGRHLRPLVEAPGWQGEPQWSPNDNRIVYVGDADAPKPGRQLFVSRPGSGTAKQITFARHGGGPFARAPSWSPDGRQIVFEQFTNDAEGLGFSDSALMVISPSGLGRRLVSSGWVSMEAPDWSPSGDLIVFTRVYKDPKYGDREYGLASVRADGTGPARLTDTGESEPAWAPNAERIAFYDGTSSIDGGGRERGLMVMARDGSMARLVVNARDITGIDWQPRR